jgi:hypothetical protein
LGFGIADCSQIFPNNSLAQKDLKSQIVNPQSAIPNPQSVGLLYRQKSKKIEQ